MTKMFSLLSLILFAVVPYTALAQYPNKSIRLIVPYPAGASSTDIMGRLMAERLSAALGQNVVVDNRPGGGGTVGSKMVAKSAPDGYTLLIGVNGPLAIGPHVYDNIGFDPVKDLAPISMVSFSPFILVAHPSLAAGNMKELIALAKSKPGSLHYASAGIGSTPHLAGELLKNLAGIELVHVPYKGGSPAMIALLGAEIPMYFTGVTAAGQYVRTGKLRALGMAGLKRSALMPEIPTISEQGVREFDVTGWNALMAPAHTPGPIVRRLYEETARVLNTPETKNFILGTGAEPVTMDPVQFGAYLRAELAKWEKVVKLAGGFRAE